MPWPAIYPWIDAAVKRKVQQLHLRVKFFLNYCYCGMPVSLYACETLVSLKLESVNLDDVEVVSFPRLKTMHLSCVCLSKLSKDAAFERFISCCPVLEDLRINGCVSKPQPFRVHSRSLKRLDIGHGYSTLVDSVPGVVIDAPQLCCLRIMDSESKSFIINNLKYKSKVVVDVTFGFKFADKASLSSGITLIRSFLSGISKVGDLTIYGQTFQIIYDYSKSESLPQFGYMSRLCVSLFSQHLKGLATFLESCPNLKSLVVLLDYLHYEELHPEEMNQINFFPGISKVRDMIIHLNTFKLICEYLKIKVLPRFGYMTRLHVTICYSPLELLLTFLESFPNLKSLSLIFNYAKIAPSDETNQIRFSSVPECLLSSLEFVDFRISMRERLIAMKLVRYFLENSAILKNLTLSLINYSISEKSAFKELLKMPRGSTECEVVLLDWFFDSNKESWIRKLRIDIPNSSHSKSFPTRWIDAVSTRRIEHLDVRFAFCRREESPSLNIYVCQTLVQLQLQGVALASAEFLSLMLLNYVV
ncbi:unnamed protein product [Arabidopsis halleri]